MTETMAEALARLTGTMSKVTDSHPRARLLLYGDSGGGKTVLAAGIAKSIIKPNEKIVFIDTSEGYESLKKHGDLADGIWQLPYTTIDDLEVIATAIQYKQPPFENVGCIILDEASSITGADTDKNFEARRSQTDSATPEWPDYNATLFRFRSVALKLYETKGLHVILLAHVSTTKDRRGNILRYFPSFAPSIAKKVKENLHLVGHMSAQQVMNPGSDEVVYTRTVQVNPTALYDAKNRIVGMDNVIKYSDMELVRIIKNWLASGGAEKPEEFAMTPSDLPEDELPEEVQTPAEIIETENAEETPVANTDDISIEIDIDPIEIN